MQVLRTTVGVAQATATDHKCIVYFCAATNKLITSTYLTVIGYEPVLRGLSGLGSQKNGEPYITAEELQASESSSHPSMSRL
jgi:hypothetical protein